MKILFIHQNFPGQYSHIAAYLLRRGDAVVAIAGPSAVGLPGVHLFRYNAMPATGIPACDPLASDFQIKCLRARAVCKVLAQIVEDGFVPDVILGHPGWGELLAVKDILPNVPVIHHVEFIYQLRGGDYGFDPEFANDSPAERTRLRLRRATQLMAFHDLDWGLAPTHWQASTAPQEFCEKISVIHEGIDSTLIRPNPSAYVEIAQKGLRFEQGSELVSYVARNLEPYRGFHVFMRCLPDLLARRPKAHVIIVGSDGVSYGKTPRDGGTWRQALMREVGSELDMERVHFVGHISHALLHNLFSVSACHVYLTYPFVLSWSLLEAMSCGALVVGSATAPLLEVIEHGHNGFLVNFFDVRGLASQISDVLADPQQFHSVRDAARQSIVSRYDLKSICLPKQLMLIEKISQARQQAC